MERNKFFGIIRLYPERARFIGDIIIPYGIKKESYPVFLEWIRDHFYEKIVLKKEGYQCCNGITMVDLGAKSIEENIQRASFALDDQMSCLYRPYILPYYSFRTEYRIYFIKSEGDIRFYSLKQKHLRASEHDIFSIKTLSESMKFEWSHVSRSEWKNLEKIFEEATTMVRLMDFETGTLEFGENEKGDIIFFEVNPMGSPMMYQGEDEQDIHEYYTDLFALITKNVTYG